MALACRKNPLEILSELRKKALADEPDWMLRLDNSSAKKRDKSAYLMSNFPRITKTKLASAVSSLSIIWQSGIQYEPKFSNYQVHEIFISLERPCVVCVARRTSSESSTSGAGTTSTVGCASGPSGHCTSAQRTSEPSLVLHLDRSTRRIVKADLR